MSTNCVSSELRESVDHIAEAAKHASHLNANGARCLFNDLVGTGKKRQRDTDS